AYQDQRSHPARRAGVAPMAVACAGGRRGQGGAWPHRRRRGQPRDPRRCRAGGDGGTPCRRRQAGHRDRRFGGSADGLRHARSPGDRPAGNSGWRLRPGGRPAAARLPSIGARGRHRPGLDGPRSELRIRCCPAPLAGSLFGGAGRAGNGRRARTGKLSPSRAADAACRRDGAPERRRQGRSARRSGRCRARGRCALERRRGRERPDHRDRFAGWTRVAARRRQLRAGHFGLGRHAGGRDRRHLRARRAHRAGMRLGRRRPCACRRPVGAAPGAGWLPGARDSRGDAGGDERPAGV
ncbi:MAG: ADP-dependent (S)-NAD(P)H-hydrate dehydratase, partial [uncultured Ramlibacter sp.]